MLSRFIQYIQSHRLFTYQDELLVAVSGGVDSVVLCDLCKTAGFRFQVAHANFQLRGEDSLLDECFVKGIAERYNVTFHVKKFDTHQYANEHKLSVQAAARQLRYDWFHQLLHNELRYIVTAHHSDDNIETMLMNFFRGTGIAGLKGMLPINQHIIRPLLFASKNDILQYAREKKLSWREDASNATGKYSRNYFRNAVIPMVNNIFPEAEANLAANVNRFAEVQELYMQAIEQHKKKLLEHKGDEIHIPILKLRKTSPLHTIVYEVTKEYGFSAHQVSDIIQLFDGVQGAYVQSATHRIIKNRTWLIIAPQHTEQAVHIAIDQHQQEATLPGGILYLRSGDASDTLLDNDANVAVFDMRQIKFPLLLRQWKAGDYFYPLGMRKKKKVSRFLIDQKLSPTEKAKVFVLETDKRICWVVGMRIDDRFKVVSSSRVVLRITLEHA